MNTRIIKIKIHEESDLYSPFDPEQKQLSEDVSLYLNRNYVNVRRKNQEQLVLQIYSDTPVDRDRVTRRFNEYFSQELDNVNYQLKRLTIKEICLGIVGAALLTLWAVLSVKTSAIRAEILCIMGWVPVWEATNIALTERPELLHLRTIYNSEVNVEVIMEDH